MVDNPIQKEAKRLKNLKNYRNKDKYELERIAKRNVWFKQINIASKFENDKKAKEAEALFINYLDNYEFDSFADVQNIANLVYEEILERSIQKEIDKIVSDKNTKFVPDKIIQSLHSVQEKVLQLKEKSGIIGTKDQDDLTALQELKKKFAIYIPFHRNEFTFYAPEVCKDCGSKNIQPVLIRRRCNKENFEILKHPFFSGRFWYNRRGIELVKAGIWTKEEYAFVFFTSVSYVNWVLENEYKIIEIDGVEEEEIKRFINERPHLQKPTIPEEILENNKKLDVIG